MAAKLPSLLIAQFHARETLCRPYDRYFYNETLGSYSVDGWLNSLVHDYGGVDSVLLWPTYTNIGADDRSQFELVQALPGGLRALKQVVQQLHARGVHVLWPYNPWDQGTHGGNLRNLTAAAATDAERLAQLLAATGADGFFGDTITASGLKEFYQDSVRAGRPVTLK